MRMVDFYYVKSKASILTTGVHSSFHEYHRSSKAFWLFTVKLIMAFVSMESGIEKSVDERYRAVRKKKKSV